MGIIIIGLGMYIAYLLHGLSDTVDKIYYELVKDQEEN